jgi:hypothetical protein
MHPGSIHFGIEPYAPEILAEVIARYGLDFGTMHGGVTTLGNQHCTLLLSDVEGSVVFKFSIEGATGTTYSPFTFLRAVVAGGVAAHPLNAPDSVQGEERIKAELHLINKMIESGVFDVVLNGNKDWIPKYQQFEREYGRLNSARFFPPIKGHPEENSIYEKKNNDDLTWMDDVKRILAEQESKS